MNASNNKIKWGIAGLGNIATRFATALTQHCDNAELYAVAARDQNRAQGFGEKYGCDTFYGSYEALAKDPNVQAIYVATVHPYHQPLTELFLKHKKHVLVEKPAFTNVADWLAMSALAKQQGVLLLEAMKTVAFPAYQELKSYLVDNQIQLTSIEAGFGNEHDFDPDLFIFNHELAGGTTLDVGVYGLWLFCDLCDTLNVKVSTPAVKMSTSFTQSKVDEDALFQFDGAISGTISASIVKNLPREALLKGKGVTITIHDKWWNPSHISIETQNGSFAINHPIKGNGFEYEIEHFSQLLLDEKHLSAVLKPHVTEQVLSIMEHSLVDAGYAHLTQR
ncbi:Gfo/Idh/MocA family protein [Vibrio penaeicida]|uniref:Oxidoreductase n=1 Tax=Vibrio penaeicida TaxID=104609 RepID=A0AAV5NZU0_9VIBR|nr:Gfo/Idh/MocA family oxidoreductase [Vibrio penaeicida]RTZ22851.1 Gfo/Idh/MocA family oxidoreductase [Vibrio penaeicida]GLQ75858.1 oxidoreductase [Vibrio penaeicida]